MPRAPTHAPPARLASPLDGAPRPDGARPRIWAVGISRLQGLYQELLPEFDTRAELRIFSQGYDAAVAEIEAAGDSLDVVVAAGSNGAYLRRRVGRPVVLVNVTGIDLIQALAAARRIHPAIALITHGDTVPEIERFKAAFDIDFPHRAYRNREEAAQLVFELEREGVRVIVGPGIVTDMATRAGMSGVFLYSPASVRQAFETALEIASAARAESKKRDRLDAVLQHLRDGVVSLDSLNRVESINDKMLGMLGIERSGALGKRLGELHPALSTLKTLAMASDATFDTSGAAAGTLGRGAEVGESVVLIDEVRYAVSATRIVQRDKITGAVMTFQEARTLQRLDRSLRTVHRHQDHFAVFKLDDLIGRSASLKRLRNVAARYAVVDATTLILGESGSGKELLAQGMHNAGARREAAFVAVNCGALPENLLESELFGYEEGAFTGARRGGKPGLIEAAHGGTLFLDEIGEMPATVQVRLLRVLQQRELIRLGATRPTRIDIRVIAATHRPLETMVAEGAFRQDLYYRLNILRLEVPPLRGARRADILPLFSVFFKRALARNNLHASQAAPVTLSALRSLRRYRWPGNVRELENVAERLAVHACMGGTDEIIDARALSYLVPEMLQRNGAAGDEGHRLLSGDGTPAAGTSGAMGIDFFGDAESDPASLQLKRRSRSDEKNVILKALRDNGGDRDAACRQLGISRTTLWRRLRETQSAA